ncbi:PIR protein, putative [Plasmodium sp. gorilla clade G1]|nr:PIR protein, putative [Plasmodium sp. gorilla clade G1]
MKLHDKILLFSLPLNILVLSRSYAHNKNKPYITPQTPTNTSRVLSECDINTSIYDKDPDMKSVKENFDRQTSQRFEEYEEHMQEKRRKCKEQCDKDIQQIILKDKMDKSLAKKVEQGCLRCGCGLGGVAAGVGIIGAIAVNVWSKAATAAAIESAKQAGIQKGMEVGTRIAIEKLREINVIGAILPGDQLTKLVTASYGKAQYLSEAIYAAKEEVCASGKNVLACSDPLSNTSQLLPKVGMASIEAHSSGNAAVAAETSRVQTAALEKINTTYLNSTTAITTSIIVILIIVLIMVIIYLILRYRRKRKMNKKAEYTKLLNH